MTANGDSYPVIVIGAGPAGLAATLEIARRGGRVLCLEADDQVGGLSRTVEYNGFRFDIGGHRFYTKHPEVQRLWRETLRDEFLRRPRLSRIYYNKRFFCYPLKPLDAFRGIGLVESGLCACSFLKRKLMPYPTPPDFRRWTANQFGDRLYHHFFEAYTEKVWGIPCDRLVAEWGAQRIKGLSLWSTVCSALLPSFGRDIKTLIHEFEYPRLGPGQMYERMAAKAEELGAVILKGHRASEVVTQDSRVCGVTGETNGVSRKFSCDNVISTMPLTDLACAISPSVNTDILQAADALSYRGLLTVNLMLKCRETAPDTWIYIHDPELRMGRLQVTKNWSPDLVPDADISALGCEFFVTEGDDLWQAADDDLIELAKRELLSLGLADPDTVFDAFVVRSPKAYPVFDLGYETHVNTIRDALAPTSGLQMAGRYGLFRYNNMDHSVLTGLYAARNLFGESHDMWTVNVDDEYHEEEVNGK